MAGIRSTMVGCGLSFLYVIASSDGVVKVGKANDPQARLAQLQGATHVELRLVFTRPIAEHLALVAEGVAHDELAQHRLRGEHFQAAEADAQGAVERACAEVEAAHAQRPFETLTPGKRGRPVGTTAAIRAYGLNCPPALLARIRRNIEGGAMFSAGTITYVLKKRGLTAADAAMTARAICRSYRRTSQSVGDGLRVHDNAFSEAA